VAPVPNLDRVMEKDGKPEKRKKVGAKGKLRYKWEMRNLPTFQVKSEILSKKKL